GENRRISDREPLAEILSNDVVADLCKFAIESITKASGASLPGRITEGPARPIAALIGTIVEILPARASPKQQSRYRGGRQRCRSNGNRHRRGSHQVRGVVCGYCSEEMQACGRVAPCEVEWQSCGLTDFVCSIKELHF